MGSKKTYQIEIPNLETVAYMRAMAYWSPGRTLEEIKNTSLRDGFDLRFPGGYEGAVDLADAHNLRGGGQYVFDRLRGILDNENITHDSAPWLEPQAPREIDGSSVTYSAEGIKVGCRALTLGEMREMVWECERIEEEIKEGE